VLAKERFDLRERELGEHEFVPFSATTRMSGVNMDGTEIRKGAADAVKRFIEEHPEFIVLATGDPNQLHIEEEAKLSDIVELLSLGEGEITVSAVTATDGGALPGKSMSELHIPPGCNPAAILRGSQVVMPEHDVRIEVGDVLLFVTNPGAECRLEELS